MQSTKNDKVKSPINDTITLADFVRHEIPVEKLDEFNIYIPAYYRDYYHGIVFIIEEEVTVKNLFLDDLRRESKNNHFFIFRKNVSVENTLIQKETEFGPLTTFQGNVIARNIWTGGGYTTFEKDVTVAQTFIGVYNHGTTIVKGSLEAEAIISSEHALSARNIKKGYTIGKQYDDAEYEPIDILQSKYYDKWEETLNESNILKAILKGDSIISSNSIQSPLEKRFTKMQESKTKKLDLSYMDLEAVPEKVWEFAEITTLDISGNYITTIPDGIVNLKNLKKICIDNCEFTSFPEVLLRLTWLEEIEVGNNQLSDLPHSISALQSLRSLKLDKCHFKSIPKILYSLPQLTELDISYQQTKSKLSIDKSFTKLKKLNLEGNFQPGIQSIQPKLVELNISDCKLNALPKVISEMTTLSVLGMMNNLLESFPFEIDNLANMKDLSFDLSLLNEKSIQLLNGLPKLTTLRLNIADTTSDDIEQLLQIEAWTKLYTNDEIEDMFVGKKLLERRNLKLIEMKGEKMNLKEARILLGIAL